MELLSSLHDFRPEHQFFTGIDSDGCVFDSMEVKQKEFFIPLAMKHFDLWPVSGIVRKTWEFVNLYSIHRGGNRFISLVRVFDMLNENGKIRDAGVILPDTTSLKEWIRKENRLGNDTLRRYFELNHDPGIEKILLWSEAVNIEIGRWLKKIPPFPNARKTIERISRISDLVVVSQTPLEAIIREWDENNLRQYVKAVAGQEQGTKTEHISIITSGRYQEGRMLMIGDARGDLEAARNNGILFYPVIPGSEDASWLRLNDEAFEKFINGTYSGEYENSLLKEFKKSLPDKPLSSNELMPE